MVCPVPLAKRKGLLYTYGTISEEDKRMLNLLDSAYIFDARRKENPIETAFVHDDKAAWHNAMKNGTTPEYDGVVWGALFEEARIITKVTIRLSEPMAEFSNRLVLQYALPGIEWLNSKCYTWFQGRYEDFPAYARQIDEVTYEYDAPRILTCGLRFYRHRRNFPFEPQDLVPCEIFAEGPETKTAILNVESGLWGCKEGVSVSHVHNGGARFTDDGKLECVYTELIKGADRTVVTLTTARGDVSFLPHECVEKGYMAIPDFGLLISAGEVPAGVRENPVAAKTIRERVAEAPWRTFEATQKDIGLKPVSGVKGKTDNFTRYEPAPSFVCPDKRMNEHWKIGLSHLMAFCTELGEGRWDVKIGPYPMFATESSPIVKMLEIYGRPDVAMGAINVFLDSADTTCPEGFYNTVEGCMNIPYGIYKTDNWIPYEPAYVLMSVADHYLLSRDKKYLAEAKDKLIACVKWHFRSIDDWAVSGAEDEGLLPPTRNGDISDWGTYFEGDAVAYRAIRDTLSALGDICTEEELRPLTERLEKYRADIRRAYRRCLSRTPVVALRNGTYAPSFVVKTYLRGWMSDTWPFSPCNALRGAWMDVDHCLQIFDAGLFGTDEIEFRWVLDAYEDNLALNPYLLPKKWDDIRQDPETGARDATACKTDFDPEKDWYAWGGTGWQNGYCPLMQAYLRTGEAKAYIRTFYNTYALHADPDNFWLREHAASLRYSAKTFEEGWMLYRLRAILVWDEPDSLSLCRCAPDEWYEKGFEVKDMPTNFGTLSMKCDGKTIGISLKRTAVPAKITLRVKNNQTVVLDADKTEWTVEI